LIKSGSERSLALGRTISALIAADVLPGMSDYEALEKPIGRAWVRRVGGRNIWLWYRFNESEVMLLTITTEPPIPFDEEPGSA